MFHRLVVMASAAVLAGVRRLHAEARGAARRAGGRPAPPLKSGLDLTGFDRSVRPQDDLYRFAGGAWLANTPIPRIAPTTARSSFSMTRRRKR